MRRRWIALAVAVCSLACLIGCGAKAGDMSSVERDYATADRNVVYIDEDAIALASSIASADMTEAEVARAAELDQMARIVSAYLDMAEMQASRHIPMTMEDWENRLNGFLTLWDRDILKDAGKVSAIMAKTYAETEFEKYRIIQDRLYESDFDRFLAMENN